MDDESPEYQLPAIVNIVDLRNLLRVLSRYPDGLSPVEITDIYMRRLFDPRKVHGYERLGVLQPRGDRYMLSRIGTTLANCLANESKIYKLLISSVPAYEFALRWIENVQHATITFREILEAWESHCPELSIPARDDAREEVAVGFFNLCHAAGLGVSIVGRKGQPSRLIADLPAIKQFGYSNPIQLPSLTEVSERNESPVYAHGTALPCASGITERSRLFISIGRRKELVALIEAILMISDVDCYIHERSLDGALPSPSTVLEMRRCTGAIFFGDCSDSNQDAGTPQMHQELIAEIITAHAICNGRVIVLWQGKKLPETPFQSALQSYVIPRSVSWEAGVEIGRIIREFRSSFLPLDSGKVNEAVYH